MALFDQVKSGVLGFLGLNFDFDIDIRRAPLNEVDTGLYVGRKPVPDEAASLSELGITHVVSCLPEHQRQSVGFLATEFSHHFIEIHDGMHESIASAFPAFFARVQRCHAEGGTALVHCEVGVSRSATLAIAWVMQAHSLSFFDAYLRVRARRNEVLPNIGFASELQVFESTLGLQDSAQPSSLARYLKEICKVPVEIELIEESLTQHEYRAPTALTAIFGGEIPRVVQGVRR